MIPHKETYLNISFLFRKWVMIIISPAFLLFFFSDLTAQTFKNATEASVNISNSIVVPVPAGTMENDLLIATFNTDNQSTSGIPTPLGWTLLDHGVAFIDAGYSAVYYKLANNSEPASYTFILPSNTKAGVLLHCYGGVNPSDPIQVHTHDSPATMPYQIAPDITAISDNALLVRIYRANVADITNTIPTGYGNLSTFSANGKETIIIDKLLTTTGNQGSLFLDHSSTTSFRNSSIIINAINNPPAQGNEYISLDEDTFTGVNILLNNTDIDGDIVSLNSLTAITSQGGIISHNTITDSVIIYFPPANFNGIDTAFYTVKDDGNPVKYNTDSIFITVLPVNDPPTQGNEIASTLEDISTTTPNVLLNNIDIDGDNILTVIPSSSEQGGTVSFNITPSTFNYLPPLNFNGLDTIIYSVCDTVSPSSCALDSVFITVIPVNDPPTQGNEYVDLALGATVTLNLLANNVDPDGSLLWVNSIGNNPSSNSYSYDNDSTLTYTASSAYSGIDTVFYTVVNNDNEVVLDTVFVNISCMLDPLADCDGDGVNNGQENIDGTDPNNPCDYEGIVLSSISGVAICEGTTIFFNNQSLTTAGIYKDTLSNVSGCDSIVSLQIIILPIERDTLDESICDGTNYLLNGTSYTTGGTYSENFISVLGCDSIVTLNLTIDSTQNTILNEEICDNGSYLFNGVNYTTAGTYTENLLTAEGCDSIVTLNLSLNPAKTTTLNEAICVNESFDFNGSTYMSAGTYTANLTTVTGCDSIVTLNLTVTSILGTTLNEEICANSSYSFNGTNYNTTGSYTANLLTTEGCDSTVTLNLTVHPEKTSTLTEEICANSSYSFNGTSYNTTGSYTANLLTTEGCDSTVTLNLIVHPIESTILNETICQGSAYLFNGVSYSTEGTYSSTISSSHGCDSILTLNLTIGENYRTTINQSICAGSTYTFNNKVYSTTGIYQDTLRSTSNCDSIFTLNIISNPNVYTTILETICDGSSYFFNGNNYTTGGTYTAQLVSSLGCDSIVTLGLTLIPCVDLALSKDLAANQSDTVRLGETIDYEICVNNENITPAYNIEITDHLPQGMVLDPSSTGWILDSTGKAIYTIPGPLTTGQQICIPIRLSLLDPSAETINNYAEISGVTDVTGVFIADFDSSPKGDLTDGHEDDIDFVPIIFNPCPSVIVGSLNIDICKGDTIQLEGFGGSIGATYQWSGTGYMSCTDCPKPFVSPDTITTYVLTIHEITGCSASNFSRVTVHNPPELDLGLGKNICSGSTITLDAGIGASTYQWTASDGSNVASVANPTVMPINNSVTYCVTITDAFSCTASDCTSVNVRQELRTNLEEQICDGTFYDFNGKQLTTTGVYTDTLISATGCDSIVTLDLSTQPCVDLALQKDLALEQSDTVRLGDKISYKICINNEGISSAYNILITDHLPQGMFLDPDNIGWTLTNNGDATYTIPGPLAGGEQTCVSIFLNLLDPSTETINNYAEISGVTDERGVFIADFDSSPSDVIDDEFEDDIDFVPVIFDPCPFVIVGSLNINICKGDTIQLEGFGGSANAIYQWGGPGGLSCVDCPKPFVSPDTTTTYVLTIKEVTGCEASNFSRIVVHTPPPLDLGPDRSICNGSTINLDANVTAVSYEWTTADDSSIVAETSLAISPSTTTDYCLTITDEFGCTATDCVTVFVKETLRTNLEEQICDGSFYLFDGQELTTSGTYTDILQSSTGCDSIVTLQLSKVPCVDLSLEKDLAINQSDTVRIGETIHYEICIDNEGISPAYNIEITDHIPAGLNLSTDNAGWTLIDNKKAIYTIDGPLRTGDQICVPIYLNLKDPSEGFIKNYAEISGVTDERGVFIADFDSSPNNDSVEEEEFEDDIDFETIYFDPCPFVLIVGQRFTICEGDSIKLQALGGSDLASYEWGTQRAMSCYDCKNPIVSPKDTTVYILTIHEVTGCSVSTTITVNVQKKPSTNLGGDQFICLGATTTLTADEYEDMEWTTSDGTFLSSEATLSVSPTSTTTYCINTVGEGGCTNSDCATIFVEETITTTTSEQICEGDTYNFNGQSLTESGQYSTTLIGEMGCDSIVNLDLLVYPVINSTLIDTICIGTSYSFNNQILTEAGTYTNISPTRSGCDSISTLILRTENCSDLSLHTQLSAGQKSIFAVGDTVDYEIIVSNEGAVTMHTIQIVSRLPEGISPLSEGNNGWTLNRSPTFFITDPLEPNNSSSINLRLRIEPTVQGSSTADILTEITAMYYADGTLAQDIDSGTTPIDDPDLPLEDDESIITLNLFTCSDFAVSAGAYQRVCQGETVLLEATGGVAYEWSPRTSLSQFTIFNPLATPMETTIYTVTVTDSNGCTATDQVQVIVDGCATPPPLCKAVALACPDKTICKDESAQLVVSGGVRWEWSPKESLANFDTDIPIATPSITTKYTVTVTDENGCTGTDEVLVIVEDCATPPACEAIAFACPDKTICKGRSAQLVVSGGVRWEWSPKESLSNFNSDIPVASPTVTTDYTVTVTDQNGCTVEEYVTVFVNDCRKSITDTEEQILVQAKIFLQGAMIPNEEIMHDKLRVENLIPLEEPYAKLRSYDNKRLFQTIESGEETITSSVLETTGSDAIVDWVFLELRWEYDPSKVIRTRSALVQRDGDIVDLDGYSPVRFTIPVDNYFLAVRHRNHLGVMTEKAISMKRNSLHTVDFTKNDASCYALKDGSKSSQYPMIQIGDVQCLWGGNSNGDNKLIFQGPQLDQEKLFFDIALHPDNISEDGFPNYNFIIRGYLQGDNNMDGELRYQGPNNDVDDLQFFNVLQHQENERFLTNKIIYEQLPR